MIAVPLCRSSSEGIWWQWDMWRSLLDVRVFQSVMCGHVGTLLLSVGAENAILERYREIVHLRYGGAAVVWARRTIAMCLNPWQKK